MAVAQTNPAINEAWGVIKVLSGDEQARAMAEAREKAQMDMDSLLSDTLYDGKLEIARNLLRKNMSHEDIADVTGLTFEEVKKLAADLS